MTQASLRKRGRKPLPTQIRVLRGNPGGRPLNPSEAKVSPGIPTAPKELSAGAKREWKRAAKQLYDAGLLTELDRMGLAALVASFARWLEAQAILAKTGMIITDAAGVIRRNPLLIVASQAQAEYTRMLSEFGLTPSSRSRVKVAEVEEGDKFEDFLSGKAK